LMTVVTESVQTDKLLCYSRLDLVRYFLRLGTFGFGGSVALVGFMHRDLVEKRRWIAEADYKEGLALALKNTFALGISGKMAFLPQMSYIIIEI